MHFYRKTMGLPIERKDAIRRCILQYNLRMRGNEQLASAFPGNGTQPIINLPLENHMKMGVGFIKGTFKVNSRLLEEDPANHRARLLIEGSGAASAFKAEIQINCNSHPEGTELAWIADATVSGPLGSVAKGLVENVSQKVVNQTLECVTSKVSSSS